MGDGVRVGVENGVFVDVRVTTVVTGGVTAKGVEQPIGNMVKRISAQKRTLGSIKHLLAAMNTK